MRPILSTEWVVLHYNFFLFLKGKGKPKVHSMGHLGSALSVSTPHERTKNKDINLIDTALAKSTQKTCTFTLYDLANYNYKII